MNIPRKLTFLLLLLIAVFVSYAFQAEIPSVQKILISPTPTYGPFVEPPLPPNPTEFELGRNLYWHWCMPCHGDRGQGLTDEFRGEWEPEHQNCWARGCHTGHKEDGGFPIPTVVPALVRDDHLEKFSSAQDLADFLRATHPPQSPGILKSEEYHAIALFVFTINGRSAAIISPTASSTPAPRSVPVQSKEPIAATIQVAAFFIVIVIAFILLILGRRKLKT